MRSATGEFQSILILGGRSEIALAIVDRLATTRLERLVLAMRDPDTAIPRPDPDADLASSAMIQHIVYDATDPTSHERAVADASSAGDLDLIVVAFGALGEVFDLDQAPATTVDAVALNGAAACGAAHAAASQLIDQGHGTLVLLSSVAGLRVRRENAPYAAGKAAFDGFGRALTDMTDGSDVHVVVVRPGFVIGQMTAGRSAAPFATTPERVAADVVAALDRRRSTVVWSPAILRAVFAILRVVPGSVWRRLAR